MAGTGEMYLGVPLIAEKPIHFQNLIDKVNNRLQPWQAQFLSHAGMAILIKSVVEPLLNYTMATTLIPISIRAQLKASVRRFFWDKQRGSRYMLLISWEKNHITKITGWLRHKGFG
jgi:hypothetical protein